jgi:hypothetical protein
MMIIEVKICRCPNSCSLDEWLKPALYQPKLCISLDQSQGNPERFSQMPLSHFLARLTSPEESKIS